MVWGVMLLLLAPTVVAGAQEPNQAGLVIQSGEGQVETICIGFDEDEITGDELLVRSGLDLVLDPSSSMGVTLCRVEELGCNYPAEHCFCQCMGGGDCSYWNYFYRDAGADSWTYSALGTGLRKVRPGAVEAWVWGDGRQPPSEELTFEAICLPPTPEPTPTVVPTVPVASPEPTLPATQSPAMTEVATEVPVPTHTAGWPSPSPSPQVVASVTATPTPESVVQEDASWMSYLPFGLMIVALGAVGVFVWRRRS
jgi:hypothetical protein